MKSVEKFFSDSWYIELLPGKKYAGEWGGWETDFEENPNVYTYEETQKIENDRWGIVGTRKEGFSLLVFDIDLYKAGDEEQKLMKEFIEEKISKFNPVFKAENKDSYHVPYYVPTGLDLEISEGDLKDYIDICGEIINERLVVAPNSPYEATKVPINDEKPRILTKDDIPKPFLKPEEEREKNKKVDFDAEFDGITIGNSENIDKENMPPCIKLMVKKLEEGGLHGGKGHKARLFLSWTLLHSGWSKKEVFKLFKKHSPEKDFDASKTKDPLNHWDKKEYFPHSCDRVKSWGLCPGCERSYVLFDNETNFDIPSITKNTPIDKQREVVNQIVDQTLDKGMKKIIKVAPGLGKTYSALERGMTKEIPLAYFAERHELIGEKKQEFVELFREKFGYEPKTKWLEGASRICPSLDEDARYRLENGMTAEDIKTLYSFGVSASVLHSRFDLPCGDNCPWENQFPEDYDEFDAVFAPMEYIHKPELVSHKNVVVDEASYDHFIKKKSFNISAKRLLNDEFLNKVLSDDDYWLERDSLHTDTGTEEKEVRLIKTETRTEKIKIQGKEIDTEVSKREIEDSWTLDEWLEYCIENHYHPRLPSYCQALRKGEKMHEEKDTPTLSRYTEQSSDIDEEQQTLSESNRGLEKFREMKKKSSEIVFLADEENMELQILKKPPLHWANSVLALDAYASEEMWQEYVHPMLELVDIDKIVLNEIGLTVKKYTDNMHYVCNNHYDVEDDDTVLEFLEEKPEAAFISSKDTVEKIAEKGLKDEEKMEYFYNLKGTNSLREYDEIGIGGAPHTGHERIFKLGALAGEEVKAGGKGKKLDYSGIGKKIFDHDREKEILQGIHRTRPVEKGSVKVHLFTGVVPEGLPVHFDKSEPARNAEDLIIDFLKTRGPAKTKTIAEKTNYSMQHVRRVLKQNSDVKDMSSVHNVKIWRYTARGNSFNLNPDVLRDYGFDDISISSPSDNSLAQSEAGEQAELVKYGA